jgi:hypothetical protein
MKAYGIKKKDWGCCPGHDKFASDTYNTATSQKAHTRDTKYAHGRARMEEKQETNNKLNKE